jgi:ribonucleoside-diphosphate reductase alpha chain
MIVAEKDVVVSAGGLRDEPSLTENGRKVLEARYLKKDEAGQCVETPSQLYRRVARTIADVELVYGATVAERDAWEERFYELMSSRRFMPNSPTLMNAGREMGMLSACFVLPVGDSVVDIFNSIKHTALIQKAGGGTGFAFDELRPTGDLIKSSGGTTSGPITFWRAFSEATNAIQQGAFRRGANMGMMYVHHPDILKFLYAKQDLNQFTNYNISVKLTDTWMEEFRANPDSPQVVRNPRDGKSYVIPRNVDIWKHNIRDLVAVDCVEPVPSRGRAKYFTSPRLVGRLPADLAGKVYTKRDIWNIIVQNAWQTGEPGVVFIDRINEQNPTPHVGRIEATNPCGEQPLLPYEACNLGSLNLGLFVRDACTPAASVDWDALRQTVHLATRYLDNVLDANNYPLPEIEAVCLANRKIGLGIMGFADALFKLGVAYDSEEGIAWGEQFMRFVNDEAHACSEELARRRGCFPNWKGSIWQTKHHRPMRNAAVTTVAPTGTISIIANCSGGVEPMFSLAFMRNVLRGQRQGDKPLFEVNETFQHVARERGFLSDDLLERLVREGSLARVEGVPDELKRVFVCAHDIEPEWHARMQAAFQRHCDSAISKTINFPHDASVVDVERIYHLAYELGCKGVTVYRDGCRDLQPMALKKDEAALVADSDAVPKGDNPAAGTKASEGLLANRAEVKVAPAAPPPNVLATPPASAGRPAPRPTIEPADLPEIVSGFRIRQLTPFGNMHVKITVDPVSGRELEVFAQLGKGGDVANSDLEGLCRTASLWLRAGGSLLPLIKQWEGIGSSLQIPTRAGRIMSLPDGLACALKKYMRAKERFGLRALLLGEIDPAELDNPLPAPHDRSVASLDRAVGATPAVRALPGERPLDSATATSYDDGDAPSATGTVERRLTDPAARVNDAFERRARARADLSAHDTAGGDDGKGHGNGNGNGNGKNRAVGRVLVVSAEHDCEEVEESGEPARSVRLPAVAEASVAVETEAEASTACATLVANGPEAVAVRSPISPPRHVHDAAEGYILRCPECGGVVARQEGCLKCAQHCGWAAC